DLHLLPAGVARRLPRRLGRHPQGPARLPPSPVQFRRDHAAARRAVAEREDESFVESFAVWVDAREGGRKPTKNILALRVVSVRSARPTKLQVQLPILHNEIMPEAVVLLLLNEAEAGRLIDAARGDEHVIGPQRERAVAGEPREVDAFGNEPRPDPHAACPW